jgi:2-keto-4-pentenoate hydratase/2-oxohepta-3-ene-1,7-dioic acid hydratase in catechol pathway
VKLAAYWNEGFRVGIVDGDRIMDSGFAGTMTEFIQHWPERRTHVTSGLGLGEPRPLESVRLGPPVARPGKIFAIGLNYADHAAESNLEVPADQVWFTKAQTSINGPYDPIQIARGAPKVDYEVELVVVIGRRGKHIPAEKAAEYVFGYCVGNDVTERAWQLRTAQWSLGKSFDTHAPIGPWITTAEEVGDPHALGIRCWVNGELRQDSNTAHLVFDVWDQIAHLSRAMTLEPGDLIFTGTPAGVGVAMKPRRFLQPGDIVRCEIDRLGWIEGTMQAEEERAGDD